MNVQEALGRHLDATGFSALTNFLCRGFGEMDSPPPIKDKIKTRPESLDLASPPLQSIIP